MSEAHKIIHLIGLIIMGATVLGVGIAFAAHDIKRAARRRRGRQQADEHRERIMSEPDSQKRELKLEEWREFHAIMGTYGNGR